MEQKKSTFWKFALAFIGLIVLAIALFFGWNIYSFKSGERAVREYAEGLEKLGEELYRLQLADTVGGATPQETLSLYIEAVEAGDYELASKYFVIEKREEWKVQLINIKKSDKVDTFLSPLKLINFSDGEYSADGKGFSTYNPVGVDFVLYPSGAWKILEI